MVSLKKMILQYQKKLIVFDDINTYFNKNIIFLTKKYNIKSESSSLMEKLWFIISTVDVDKFKSEQELISYVLKSLKNTAINLFKENLKSNRVLYNSDIVDIEVSNGNSNMLFNDSDLNFESIIQKLPERQKNILQLRYKEDLSDEEIAIALGKSRQAIHKSRVSALNLLKSNALDLMG